MENISDFKEPITAIATSDDGYSVGIQGVTKIERYEEYGQMSFVPWYAIYRGDRIVGRINGAFVVEIWH